MQRRVDLMAEEGVTFVTDAHVGRNADMRDIRESADAVVLAAGATKPRDLPIEGRYAVDACMIRTSMQTSAPCQIISSSHGASCAKAPNYCRVTDQLLSMHGHMCGILHIS